VLEGGGWSASRPVRFTPGKDPLPIVQEVGWAPGPVWTCAKNLAPTGIFFEMLFINTVHLIDETQFFFFTTTCAYLTTVCTSHFHLAAHLHEKSVATTTIGPRGSWLLPVSVSDCNTVPLSPPEHACDSHSEIAPTAPSACKIQNALLTVLQPRDAAVAKWRTLGTMSKSRVCHCDCRVVSRRLRPSSISTVSVPERIVTVGVQQCQCPHTTHTRRSRPAGSPLDVE
jgi:hypothetical protein